MAIHATTLYPFVPSGPHFARSIDFFCSLGFTIDWQNDDLASLRFGGARFLLQKYQNRELQENLMIVYEVNDLDAYSARLQSLKLTERFPEVRVNEPKQFPWGRELHIIDLAGVCWHVRQSETVTTST
ncbi:MAG: hypothetical protein U0798_00510 [Gemmataceae bacterium]